jgi:hypothetical protein
MTPPRPIPWQRRLARLAFGCGVAPALFSCGGTLDAGSDREAGQLPVSADNPLILSNDGVNDNWHGEYALLLARGNGNNLAGIIISTGGTWSDLDANVSGWQELVARARESGLVNPPDPVRSASQPLRRPADGTVESTQANDSEGARFIVRTSLELAEPARPVVVATGGRLTDVADAYLLDPTVVDRVIVVASLGTGFSELETVAHMGRPNGEMDSWADVIVLQKFRYVQVSAYYDQLTDVPAERVTELPPNAFGDWMRNKRTQILSTPLASDQVSAIAVGLPTFTRGVVRVSHYGWDGDQPTLAPDPTGRAWLVTASDGAAATARFWQLLLDPATFAP